MAVILPKRLLVKRGRIFMVIIIFLTFLDNTVALGGSRLVTVCFTVWH